MPIPAPNPLSAQQQARAQAVRTAADVMRGSSPMFGTGNSAAREEIQRMAEFIIGIPDFIAIGHTDLATADTDDLPDDLIVRDDNSVDLPPDPSPPVVKVDGVLRVDWDDSSDGETGVDMTVRDDDADPPVDVDPDEDDTEEEYDDPTGFVLEVSMTWNDGEATNGRVAQNLMYINSPPYTSALTGGINLVNKVLAEWAATSAKHLDA